MGPPTTGQETGSCGRGRTHPYPEWGASATGLTPRTIPLGSLRLALPCSPTPGMPQGGALPYLGPASGSGGFGRHGAGLSECGRHLSAGLLGGRPVKQQPRPKCPPLAVAPFSVSLLLFSALEQGLGLVVCPQKSLTPENRRKQQDRTCTPGNGKHPPR